MPEAKKTVEGESSCLIAAVRDGWADGRCKTVGHLRQRGGANPPRLK